VCITAPSLDTCNFKPIRIEGNLIHRTYGLSLLSFVSRIGFKSRTAALWKADNRFQMGIPTT
jgi:hypothetical protein